MHTIINLQTTYYLLVNVYNVIIHLIRKKPNYLNIKNILLKKCKLLAMNSMKCTHFVFCYIM